ncbi:YfcL family protein [Photobacterium angustum]|uniref:YfcL family protein n=1 Tax=Photobacterium angustum TaxID=661 RepID=UPI003D0B51BC
MTIQEYEEKLLQLIDDEIDTATDDELFAGGYLRGHISLAAAECESEKQEDIEEYKRCIAINIENNKHEMSPKDRHIVNEYWGYLEIKANS